MGVAIFVKSDMDIRADEAYVGYWRPMIYKVPRGIPRTSRGRGVICDALAEFAKVASRAGGCAGLGCEIVLCEFCLVQHSVVWEWVGRVADDCGLSECGKMGYEEYL